MRKGNGMGGLAATMEATGILHADIANCGVIPRAQTAMGPAQTGSVPLPVPKKQFRRHKPSHRCPRRRGDEAGGQSSPQLEGGTCRDTVCVGSALRSSRYARQRCSLRVASS